jgi:diacylglycerol kinase (ATP)
MRVAVIAHSKKELGGGPELLRQALADVGVRDPSWFEVSKSKQVPKRVRRALASKPDVLFVWGGDGTVQRAIDATGGTGMPIAIVPAGTANLLATNLDIPNDVAAAVKIGLHGDRRQIDIGRVNGERFAVMAGVGFDALMIRDAPRAVKARLGKLAYVLSGARNLSNTNFKARVDVDGRRWFKGTVSDVLVGNMGTILGGVTVFEAARLDDGRLDVGIVTATTAGEWLRALARTALGQAAASPFVQLCAGRRIEIRCKRPIPYELDGGDRPPAKRLVFEAESLGATVCVAPVATGT